MSSRRPRGNIRRFVAAEDGAVTVDFVMLTGAVVGIAIAAVALMAPAIIDAAGDVSLEAPPPAGEAPE